MYIAIVRGASDPMPFQNRGNSINAAVTKIIRHQTNGTARSVIALPRIAVNPQSITQKWICTSARVEEAMFNFEVTRRSGLGIGKSGGRG